MFYYKISFSNMNNLNQRKDPQRTYPRLTFDALRKLQQNPHLTSEDLHYLSKVRQKGYELLGEIGRGGYGIVYKARSTKNPQKYYAIKVNFDIVHRSTIFIETGFYHLLKKKRGMSRLMNFFMIDDLTHIVLEYFDHNPFREVFARFNTLDEIRHYMLQLLKAIKTLKSSGVYHRDIKPHNFLYNIEKRKGILVDYGLSEVDPNHLVKAKSKVKQAKKKMKLEGKETLEYANSQEQYLLYKRLLLANKQNGTSKIGTESYSALQTLLHSPNQGHECQIWSAGVIFLQFLTKRQNFFSEMRIENGEKDIRYITIFMMQLAQVFGPKEVEQFIANCDYTLTLPEDTCRGDIRKLIVPDYLKDKDIKLAYDLLSKMLQLYPKARISVQQAFMHPFFDSIRKQHITSKKQHEWSKQMMQKRLIDGVKKNPESEQTRCSSFKIPFQSLFVPDITKPKFIEWLDIQPYIPVRKSRQKHKTPDEKKQHQRNGTKEHMKIKNQSQQKKNQSSSDKSIKKQEKTEQKKKREEQKKKMEEQKKREEQKQKQRKFFERIQEKPKMVFGQCAQQIEKTRIHKDIEEFLEQKKRQKQMKGEVRKNISKKLGQEPEKQGVCEPKRIIMTIKSCKKIEQNETDQQLKFNGLETQAKKRSYPYQKDEEYEARKMKREQNVGESTEQNEAEMQKKRRERSNMAVLLLMQQEVGKIQS